MSFIAPAMLWVLLALPVALVAYIGMRRRRGRGVARYRGLRLARAWPGSRWREHLPCGLLAVALTAMALALARPTAVISLPAMFETVILAIDASGSMRATDIEPSRLAAAQAAARTFIDAQPTHTRIGLVAFGGRAGVVQQPTHDRTEIRAAVDRLHVRPGTAVGAGIAAALGALFPEAGITPENPRGALMGGEGGQSPDKDKGPGAAVSPAIAASAAVILLTDGESTSGPDMIDAAHAAASRGVRVFTVGIGTPDGTVVSIDGWSSRVRLDEDALREVAILTGAQYFQAQNAGELRKIYTALSAQLVIEKKDTEITAILAAFAAMFALLSAGLSLRWFNRIF